MIRRFHFIPVLSSLACALAAPAVVDAQQIAAGQFAPRVARLPATVDAPSARTAMLTRLPPVTEPPRDDRRAHSDGRMQAQDRTLEGRADRGRQEPRQGQAIPPDFVAWWQNTALAPLRNEVRSRSIDVNTILVEALEYSPQVRAVSDNALIAQTVVVEAEAAFDPRAFLETKMVRSSTPTGSTLDAGFNVPRLRQADWYTSGGVRRRNSYGGEFEFSQRIGIRDSNSVFFTPPNQGNAQLTLSYNQPLLNGSGEFYNTSLIVLANIDTRIAADVAAKEIQDHLLQVTVELWSVYLQRAALLQKRRHLERGEVIQARLEKRREIDALDSQIARARAAVATRRAELVRGMTEIRNAEARLSALVAAPDMLADREIELVPLLAPQCEPVEIKLADAMVTALAHRPEIDSATQQIKAASVRLDVARNELLPVLDVVLETYVSGLRGERDIAQSLVDQISVGEPSYTAGLMFELPYQRRAAQARLNRRQMELRQLGSRFQAAIQAVNVDVEIAVREVETSFQELQAQYEAMLGAEADVKYMQLRWESVPGQDQAASFLLADLLDAQDRLVTAEFNFVRAQVAYAVSLIRLNRATGTLLRQQQVQLIPDNAVPEPVMAFPELPSPGRVPHHPNP